jgi:hypothetical protein
VTATLDRLLAALAGRYTLEHELGRGAAAARERNAEVREQNEAQRARMDLVTADWSLHRSRRH